MGDDNANPEVTNLRARFTSVRNFEWLAAAENPDLGSLNFRGIVPQIKSLLQNLRMAETANFEFLQINRMNEIIQTLSELERVFSAMRNFSINNTNGDPNTVRQHIINNFRTHAQNIFDQTASLIGFSNAYQFDIHKIGEEAQAKVDEIIREAAAALELQRSAIADKVEHISILEKQAADTLEQLKTTAAEVGVARYSEVFGKEAKRHARASVLWGTLTLVAAGAAAYWGYYALSHLTLARDAGTAEIVQQSLAKIIVFTALYYGLIWCARNYGANRHNFIVNRHRQNSLSTFETFVKAAEGDLETKSAVLLQATSSIFSPQPSGYSSKDAEGEQPGKIIEIVRSVKGGGDHA